MAKKYTFTEITDEMRAVNPAAVIEKIERENTLYRLQNMTEEEREAFNAEIAEEKAIAKEIKAYARQKEHNLTLQFDDEKSRDSLLNLTVKRYFSEEYGFVTIIRNATAVSTKIHYVIGGVSKKANASLKVKDVLKGKNNKFTRAGKNLLTKNAVIKNEDGTEESYTGANERVHNLIKGENNQSLQQKLDGYKTLKGDQKYPVTNVAELEEKSAGMKEFKAAIKELRG